MGEQSLCATRQKETPRKEAEETGKQVEWQKEKVARDARASVTLHRLQRALKHVFPKTNLKVCAIGGDQRRNTPESDNREDDKPSQQGRSELEVEPGVIEGGLHGRNENGEQSGRTLCQKAQPEREIEYPPPES